MPSIRPGLVYSLMLSLHSAREGSEKVLKHRIKIIIITPIWVTQSWYPLLLKMSIQEPLILLDRIYILKNPQGEYHPLIQNSSMRLAAWLISGNPQDQQRFLRQLPNSSRMPGLQALEEITSRPGVSSVVGVLANNLIWFTVI